MMSFSFELIVEGKVESNVVNNVEGYNGMVFNFPIL